MGWCNGWKINSYLIIKRLKRIWIVINNPYRWNSIKKNLQYHISSDVGISNKCDKINRWYLLNCNNRDVVINLI